MIINTIFCLFKLFSLALTDSDSKCKQTSVGWPTESGDQHPTGASHQHPNETGDQNNSKKAGDLLPTNIDDRHPIEGNAGT